MKRFSKKKIIYYILTLVVIVFMITLGVYQNVSFRKTERAEELNQEAVFESLLNKNDSFQKDYLDADLSKDETRPEKDYWTTWIDDGGDIQDPDNHNYRSVYLNLKITNTTLTVVEDYRIRMDVNEPTYFFKGWCGTFEFHQFREGAEKTQVIDFNNPPKDYSLEVYEHHEDPEDDSKIVELIPLNKGDYFIYIPSKADYFAPLVAGQSVTTGMIVYESIYGNPVSFTAYDEKSITTDLSSLSKQENKLSLQISTRGDQWTKIIDTDGEMATEPNYIGQTYDMTFQNVSGAIIKDYRLCFTAGEDMYISSGWNGSFEIHQLRNGKENVAYIKDMRNVDCTNLQIEYVQSGDEHLVSLKKGDFFYYYPSSEKLEVPLANKAYTTSGMIVYQKIGDEITSSRIIVNYHLYRSILNEPLIVVGFVFGIIWFIVLLFDHILEYRLHKFELQKEKDEKIIIEAINTFIGFIDAKDPYTNGHSRRVAYYSKLLAERMGYSEEEQQRIYYIGLMHDCGKIGIPDSILCKPERLTDEEYAIIKTHAHKGYEILKDFTSIEGIREGVLYHHERYDGKGYPEGKAGTDIPIESRILCVADSVDAMNSNRCYRKRLSKDEILHELSENAGTQFDPEIAKIMEYLILSAKIETREE